MKNISLKVSDELHGQANEKANEATMSLAELVRVAIRAYCVDNTRIYQSDPNSLVDEIRGQLRVKDTQIESQAQQIDHLTQVVAMSQKNIGALSEQLDSSRQMIEDLRNQKPQRRKGFWTRLLYR